MRRREDSATSETASLRMAELVEKSGVPRQTIHFYLREGLLPKPRKGGRTVAFYGEEHLERLRLIRRLREERYLPIAEIRRLLDVNTAAGERDLDALAEVLEILPRAGGAARAPRASVVAEAKARGLLGRGERASTADPAELRVLTLVEEALSLDEEARALTLSDLEACAQALSDLVAREATLFFDAVFQRGEVQGPIAALRRGRGVVARFITAYRDLMLRRIIDDLLFGLQRSAEAVARAATVPLSSELERRLGVPERRATLYAATSAGDGDAASALIVHLFASGASAELAGLCGTIVERAGACYAPLLLWGRYESERGAGALGALSRAALEGELELGRILLGEAVIVRGVKRREGQEGLLDETVPALGQLMRADPDRDRDAILRAFGWFHRGRVELSLPRVLGRAERGAEALSRALELCSGDALVKEPVARARIKGNTALMLGRHALAEGDRTGGQALLEEAAAVDPGGPLAAAVALELSAHG